MVFSSLLFLFYFLPAVLLLYYLVPRPLKNLVLLSMSLFFYAWGEPIYIVLMIFSSVVDYTHGILIDRFRHEKNKARWFVLSSIVINLSLLAFFKYANFFIANINMISGISITGLDLPLPIGISFYTFQTMSYSIDVYRDDAPVQKNFIAFAAYVALFPQLIAGPIVRYKTIADQLMNRRESVDQFALGIRRFCVGLGKKVLLANNIGFLWSQIQATAPGDLTVLTAWLGIIAFGFQIYFDFSGYSDMAIGLGHMFGFTFLENFNYPYISRSITEFWRRWHMSLGSWFRDYLYIPLGGNKVGTLFLVYRNLMVVWLLTGFWHGASWNFVLWGVYFGVLIAVEKAGLLKFLERMPNFLRHCYVLFLALFGWALFVLDDLTTGIMYIKVMFGMGGAALYNTQFLYYLATNAVLLLVLAVGCTPLPNNIVEKLADKLRHKPGQTWLVPAFCVLILFATTAYLVDASYNPFLYFRF